MSSGSCFELYRKYNIKSSDNEYDQIKKQYTYENQCEDLPLVLDLMHNIENSVYDKETKQWKDTTDYSIAGQRKRYQSILLSDKTYLDLLLSWDFGSGFTCLKNEWNLSAYRFSKSQYIIDFPTAEKILQACKYLLSNEWSDSFEKILDNKWINILAAENDSNSFWKYVYRKNKKLFRETETENEYNDIEFYIKRLHDVLNTYISLDNDYSFNELAKTEYLLVYTAW